MSKDVYNFKEYSLDIIIRDGIKTLNPSKEYEEKRLKSSSQVIRETNNAPYIDSLIGDNLFSMCEPMIHNETKQLLEDYFSFLDFTKQLNNYELYLTSIEFMTSCMTHLDCFSQNLLKDNSWVNYLTKDSSIDLTKQYSQKLQFIDWFTNYLKADTRINIKTNTALVIKVMDKVWSYLENEKKTQEISLQELKTIIKRSSSFLSRDPSRRSNRFINVR